jgi:hypothetical protein
MWYERIDFCTIHVRRYKGLAQLCEAFMDSRARVLLFAPTIGTSEYTKL